MKIQRHYWKMAWSGHCLIRDCPIVLRRPQRLEQLERAGQLKAEFPDVYVCIPILSENKDEIAWGQGFIPSTKGYWPSSLWFNRETVRCLHIVCIWKIRMAMYARDRLYNCRFVQPQTCF